MESASQACLENGRPNSGGVVMACTLCASDNQGELPAEINIHFPGVQNLHKPSSDFSQNVSVSKVWFDGIHNWRS